MEQVLPETQRPDASQVTEDEWKELLVKLIPPSPVMGSRVVSPLRCRTKYGAGCRVLCQTWLNEKFRCIVEGQEEGQPTAGRVGRGRERPRW